MNILLTLAILLAAPAIVSRIGATGQRIVSKIMGLITTVIGIQFVLNGVSTVLMDHSSGAVVDRSYTSRRKSTCVRTPHASENVSRKSHSA